jgi:hypothetical protein
MSIDPNAAAERVTAGVDWAKDDHAVCVVGGQGEALERFTVTHDAAGLRQLAARLLRAGALQVGIERSDGPVVETLLAFALSFDEVIVTTFTSGAQNTLPLWIFGAIRLGQNLPEVNVVVVGVLLLTIVPVVIAARLTGDGGITRGSAQNLRLG